MNDMRCYDSYKGSGLQWLGEIPSHWGSCKLKNSLTSMQDGTHGTYQRVSSSFPLLSAKNVSENGLIISENESCISEDDYLSIVSNGFPKKNDIVLCCVGTIGRCCIYTEAYPIAFQRSVTFLRVNDSFDRKYILYFLRSGFSKAQFETLAKTSAQSGIYMGDLASLNIISPPLSEQRIIAAYLDVKCGDINKAIATQQKRIKLLQELRLSIITHAVTRGIQPNAPLKESGVEWIGRVPSHWRCVRLKFYTGPLKSGGTPTSDEERFYSPDGTPWVTIADMSTNSYIYDTEKHLTKEGLDDKNLIIYPQGTILYSIYATLGKVSELRVPACINQAILAINPKSDFNRDFFKYCLQTQERFVYSISNGNTQNNLNAKLVANFNLVLPPIAEQSAIVSYIKSKTSYIDKSIKSAERQIILLQELKQSLITEVVAGKRKVC